MEVHPLSVSSGHLSICSSSVPPAFAKLHPLFACFLAEQKPPHRRKLEVVCLSASSAVAVAVYELFAQITINVYFAHAVLFISMIYDLKMPSVNASHFHSEDRNLGEL